MSGQKEKMTGAGAFGEKLEAVRRQCSRIHCITNYVTINDVANALLAVGAKPIMADDPAEASEITENCQGLNLNMGTLHRQTIPAMEQAAKRAAQLGHSIVLDPVGVGASAFRRETARMLFQNIRFSAVRGNYSEIKSLAMHRKMTTGVDQNRADEVTEDTLAEMVHAVRAFSREHGCITVVTGRIDLVSDGEECVAIYNGQPQMSAVTGTGCQLSALLTAFLAADRAEMSGESRVSRGDMGTDESQVFCGSHNSQLLAAAAAVGAMGLAGEIAWSRMLPGEGNGTYRNRILDALYCMTGGMLDTGMRYEFLE